MVHREILIIAGLDPSGNAGALADIEAASHFGVVAKVALTAITAQSLKKFLKAESVKPSLLKAELISAIADGVPSAVKIGMIGDLKNASVIRDFLKEYKLKNVVLDPVWKSTTGGALSKSAEFIKMAKILFPLATIVTPNKDEAEKLIGGKITTPESATAAAKNIWETYKPRYVLLKGGHLPGDPVDILFGNNEAICFRSKRLEKKEKRGTGCRMASAIAALLANGKNMNESVFSAKRYIEEYLSR